MFFFAAVIASQTDKGCEVLAMRSSISIHGYLFLCILLAALLVPSALCAQTPVPGELLTFQQAIDAALKNQPTVAAGIHAVRASEARIGEALANYYPQISLTGTYTRYSAPVGSTTSVAQLPTGTSASVTSVSGTTGGSYDRYTSVAGATATIFDFGRTPSQVHIQRYNTESARFNLENTKDDVVFNVKQAYYNLLQAQRKVVIGRETVEQFEKHLVQAQAFFEVGMKPKFDVTKAEVDLSNAQLALIQAENNLRLARVTLNNAMGLADVADYRVEDILSYTKYDLPYERAIDQAYSQRADLLSMVSQKRSSKESITLAKRNYLPSLTSSATYYYAGTGFPLDEGWNVGVNLTWQIFSGFLTKYQVAEAQANYDATTANEANLKLTILLQVQQAYLTLREAGERIANTELTVRQAAENLDLATGRYQAGVGNPIEVADALVAHSNAQVGYVTALYDYKIGAARVERAIGIR